jgi:hypothetical protein
MFASRPLWKDLALFRKHLSACRALNCQEGQDLVQRSLALRLGSDSDHDGGRLGAAALSASRRPTFRKHTGFALELGQAGELRTRRHIQRRKCLRHRHRNLCTKFGESRGSEKRGRTENVRPPTWHHAVQRTQPQNVAIIRDSRPWHVGRRTVSLEGTGGGRGTGIQRSPRSLA